MEPRPIYRHACYILRLFCQCFRLALRLVTLELRDLAAQRCQVLGKLVDSRLKHIWLCLQFGA